MEAMEQQLLTDILSVCKPEKVILYSEKRTLTTDRLKSVSLCIILPATMEKAALLRKLYLSLSVDLPVDLTLYSHAEWQTLNQDHSSYAAWIGRRGRVVYEQKT
jgi:hypothetical protein